MQLATTGQFQPAHYEAACRALALAKTTDEVKAWRDKAAALKAYAQQAKNRQLEIDAAEIRIRAERRLGEMLREQKDTVGLNRGSAGTMKGRDASGGAVLEPLENKAPTLAEVGIDKKLSSHAQKVAAIPESEFEEIVGEWRGELQEANARVTTNILKAAERAEVHNHRAQGTGENEWYTPQEHIERAREVLGGFDLDPASSELANQSVRAVQIFTIEDDGLEQEWGGRVWMNPPYSQPHIAQFMDKLATEYEAGNVKEAIALTHNYTDTAWFHRGAKACDAICFTRGRIGFVNPEGKRAAPTQGQAFSYFGPNVEQFAKVFSAVGFVVEVRHD